MILLSLGTHQQPFPRAIDLIAPIAEGGREVFVQHGSTDPRLGIPNTRWAEFLAFDELMGLMEDAESVVCHAGVGTIMTALQRGHTPVVIPREARFGEHVDDHQMDIAGRFSARGLIRCLTEGDDLADLLSPRAQGGSTRIGAGSQELRQKVLEAVGDA